MIESLTAVAWAFSTVGAIAQSEPGRNFIESITKKSAEKLTDAGIAKVEQLRQAIVQKLQGDPGAKAALDKAEASGTEHDLRDVAAHLDILQQKDQAFAQQLQTLVQEIKSCVVVRGDDAMVQNNYDQARGYQIDAKTGSKVYFVERMENPD
jgi:hypothetical protein